MDTGNQNEVVQNGTTNCDANNDDTIIIHNNAYPKACSNTVTLKSVIVKKPNNITSIEMRSSGTVPKNEDIRNYLSSAILKTQ